MRTTITLEPDVAAKLQKELAKGERTFKEIVNAALRRGFDENADRPKKRFVQRTWDGGGPVPSPQRIKEILLEDDLERLREAD
jgi:hypothetical protein